MKGISPLIATILLIAFTVAVGGIVSLWITGYSKTQTTQISQTSQDQIACNSVISISTYNPTFNNNSIGVRISYDYGTLPLTDVNASITCGAVTNYSTNLPNTILPGQLITGTIVNTECSSLSDITLARVIAKCTGPSTGQIFIRTGECKKGEGCMR
jgi:flagellin-like protein